MKIVILGCGRVGAHLATLLDREGHKVTILDINPNSFTRLPSSFNGTTLLGNGADKEMLETAGIREADAFIALTQEDNLNIMAAQMAKHLFNVPMAVCRVYDPLRSETFLSLGLETYSPTIILAQLIKEKVVG
jgi:trk system potassium uptake protein TrkA